MVYSYEKCFRRSESSTYRMMQMLAFSSLFQLLIGRPRERIYV